MGNYLKKIQITFLFLYVFYSDFIVSLSGISFIKGAFAILFIGSLGTGMALFPSLYKNKPILIGSVLLLVLYYVAWGFELGNYNLIVTIIYGWVLYQDSTFSKKMLIILFGIEFLLVSYEFVTHNLIYTEVSTGVINAVDKEYTLVNYFDESGFRPKGLFYGNLLATSLIIYLAVIFRNNTGILILNAIMAVMVNGRLAIIIAVGTFILKILKISKLKYGTFRLTGGLSVLIIFPVILILLIGAFILLPSENLDNFLNVLNMNTSSNTGRVIRYLAAINEFISHNFFTKLFGVNSYTLFNQWGQEVPPESEWIGMALEIGLFGVFIYSFVLYKLTKLERGKIFDLNTAEISLKYSVLVLFVSMIVYRHVFGNERGILFWFFIFLSISEYRGTTEVLLKRKSKNI